MPVDNLRDEHGYATNERPHKFRLIFSTFDALTEVSDHLFPNQYKRVFSPVSELFIYSPNQIILTQREARDERRIDNLTEVNTDYVFPTGTYCYSQAQNLVFKWSFPVAIESFWLRLHEQPPNGIDEPDI